MQSQRWVEERLPIKTIKSEDLSWIEQKWTQQCKERKAKTWETGVKQVTVHKHAENETIEAIKNAGQSWWTKIEQKTSLIKKWLWKQITPNKKIKRTFINRPLGYPRSNDDEGRRVDSQKPSKRKEIKNTTIWSCQIARNKILRFIGVYQSKQFNEQKDFKTAVGVMDGRQLCRICIELYRLSCQPEINMISIPSFILLYI